MSIVNKFEPTAWIHRKEHEGAKHYFPLVKILPSMTQRRVVKETYGIDCQVQLYLFLKKLQFTQLIELPRNKKKKFNDANGRFYKTVQKCDVCSYNLSRESSSYFVLWATICVRYPYCVLWKGRKQRVDNGRGRKFGDEPSIASEKGVWVILAVLGGKSSFAVPFISKCTTMHIFCYFVIIFPNDKWHLFLGFA